MQLFSPIKERILEYIDYKGISKYKFYQDTGITRGVLDKDSGISEENVARFIAYEKNVNIDWLITGRGKMLKTKSTEKTNKKKVSKKVSKNTEKPKIQKKLTFEEAIDTENLTLSNKALEKFLLLQEETISDKKRIIELQEENNQLHQENSRLMRDNARLREFIEELPQEDEQKKKAG